MNVVPVLRVRELSCTLGGREVLHGVSLALEPGCFLAVLGPNGAGKTTLLRVLAGLLTPQRGELEVSGYRLCDLPRRKIATLLGYVPQSLGSELPFSVRTFLALARYPYLGAFSELPRQDRALVDEMLERCGLLALSERRVDSLSGGERQRVSVAAALVQHTPTILLDEPTAYLDPRHEAEVLTLLRRANRELGKTLVMVTHDLNAAVLHAQRALILAEGRVRYDGPVAGVMDEALLLEVYGHNALFVEHPHSGQRLLVPEGP